MTIASVDDRSRNVVRYAVPRIHINIEGLSLFFFAEPRQDIVAHLSRYGAGYETAWAPESLA